MCECGGASSAPNPSVVQSLNELEFERGLWFAAQYGDIDRALHLLNKGFEVDQRDAAGYTALHYAARNGHLSLCRLLLDRGACVDAVTLQGKATPLHRASAVGKLKIVQFLVEEKKADVRLKDADGKTALHRAAQGEHYEICEFLIESEPKLKYELDNREQKPVDYAKCPKLHSLLA